MFEQSDLDRLLSAMRANGVTSLDVRTKGKRLRLALGGTAGPSQAPIAESAAVRRLSVASPGIGVFGPRGDDDGLPPLDPGAPVQAGEILGYIRQGPVRIAVPAPGAGRLTGVPSDGAVIGYGDTLFLLEPET